MGLHDGVRDERGRDGSSSEPTTVETLDGIASRVDSTEPDVDLTLQGI